MKVLVTGSSGFVGKFVIAELKNRGHSVREFDMAKGQNVLSKRDVETGAKGADAVIHLAAIVGNENPKLWEVNVNGTKNLVEATAEAGVKKFVLLSSTGVYGTTKGIIDERSPVKPENKYEESKLAAERIVLVQNGKMKTCVLRSSLIFGLNEYWARMFKLIKKKMPLPCKGNNTFQVVHAGEVAGALVKVMEKGKGGEIYLIAGEEMETLNGFCETVQEALGMEKGMNHIPGISALIIGKIFGIKVLSRENIRHISKERKYSLEKIKKLGWKQRASLKQRVGETVKELKKNKLL